MSYRLGEVMVQAENVIAELARKQHSVFTGAQAVERGVSRKALRTRVARGSLMRIDRDTFLVAGARPSWEGRVLGLVLGAGPGAVASHRAAAALWGIDGFNKGTPELTVPRGKRFRRAGAIVHESTDLDLAGIRTRDAIPVTDPARTLLDLARRSGDERLARAIESARRQHLTSWKELIATLARHARCGRPGIVRLRQVIADGVHRDEITDSDFELLVLVLLVERGLPEPILHHRVFAADGTFIAEVDLAYPGLKIAIELDGGDHRRPEVFERDRPRQNELVLAGWTVLRFTWRAYVEQPDKLVAAVLAARARVAA
ncbi:MAG: type IV toxin-antitoxin system AbiEi family antitoxin domain-containing protein [Acidimicrobiales bacterium]